MAEAEDMPTSNVNYTVKELLGRIEGKLDAMAALMATKADIHDVQEIRRQVEDNARDISVLRAISRNTRFMLATGIPAVVGLAAFIVDRGVV